MSRKTVYVCDLCYRETANPDIMRWFQIRSGRENSYLCCDCFHNNMHTLRSLLLALGIKIEGEFYCTQYAEKAEMGFIDITAVSLVDESDGKYDAIDLRPTKKGTNA